MRFLKGVFIITLCSILVSNIYSNNVSLNKNSEPLRVVVSNGGSKVKKRDVYKYLSYMKETEVFAKRAMRNQLQIKDNDIYILGEVSDNDILNMQKGLEQINRRIEKVKAVKKFGGRTIFACVFIPAFFVCMDFALCVFLSAFE